MARPTDPRRDVWAHRGRVIISHGLVEIGPRSKLLTLSGGQCVKTTDSNGKPGPSSLAADQTSEDSRVDALLNAFRNHTPMILLAGEGYEALPFSLGRAYVVLGW